MITNKKIIGNALAQFLGKTATVALAFITVKIVAGFGTDFYGQYLTAYEFLAFFGILADAGLFAIAVREMSKKMTPSKSPPKSNDSRGDFILDDVRERQEFILGNVLSMRLILILVMTLVAGISAQFISAYSDWVKWGVWITGISMALTMVAGTLNAALQTYMKAPLFSGSLVFGKAILAGGIFVLAFLYGDLERAKDFSPLQDLFFAFLWMGVISNVIFCALVFYFARKYVRISLGFDCDWWKKTLRDSLPYGMALVLQTLYLRLDLILISVLMGATAVGIYGISARVLESFLVLGVFFGQAMLPKISAEESGENNAGKLKTQNTTLQWALEKLFLISIPACTGIYFFADEIVLLLSSAEFLSSEGVMGADTLLKILIPTILCAYLNQLFTVTLVAKNLQKKLLWINAVALGVNGGLNLFLIPVYGLVAAAVSTVICEVVVFGLLYFYVRRFFSLNFFSRNMLWILGLNVMIFLIFLLTSVGQNLIVSFAFGSFIYGIFLWGMRKHLF